MYVWAGGGGGGLRCPGGAGGGRAGRTRRVGGGGGRRWQCLPNLQGTGGVRGRPPSSAGWNAPARRKLVRGATSEQMQGRGFVGSSGFTCRVAKERRQRRMARRGGRSAVKQKLLAIVCLAVWLLCVVWLAFAV